MKNQKRISICLLSFFMVCTAVSPGLSVDKSVQTADAKETEGSYIITLKSENEVEAVCDKYDDMLDVRPEETPDELSEEGILVADMSHTEAVKLEKDKRVLSVEENVTLEGNRVKKHPRMGKSTRRTESQRDNTEYVDAGQNDSWNLETIHAAHNVDKFYPINPTFKIKQLKTNAVKAGVTSNTVIKHYGIINQN